MKRLFSKTYWADKDVEILLGTLLRYGVVLSSIVVLAGGAIYLIRHGHELPEYRAFAGPNNRWDNLPAILHGVWLGHGREIIQLGVVMLIGTPIARIIFSVFAFSVEKDYLYIVITLVVLGVITFSMLGGLGG
ncbi:DUF1634 domain-containing protein [Chitinophaga agrisoli]|uniref:DUF1634 domain-containing protein n=1 Tax=Chitinophaga agrisoli TaxID=2607653 RepID=A0A5B2VLT7_9BACT|nr:DUF1634 domain-containing protein [Chitinophaga agrisoli]KAA2239227.1 DUF1634 domain-containing protein [Chitinophaga agrisoli]